MSENYKLIEDLAKKDAAVLTEKGKSYGDSWKRRGGVGAMMMLARKWDRIENIAKEHHWDIFEAAGINAGDILDDIQDLRCYLLLVEAHVRSELYGKPTAGQPATTAAPTPRAQHLPPPPAAVVHNRCATCGSMGNHAGFPCPSTLGPKSRSIRCGGKHLCEDCGEQECVCGMPTNGYVDQDR